MPHDEMAKPVLHVVSWGAAPSAWQALLGAAHVGTCGVVVPRCAATAGSCSGQAPAASYQELLAVKPWRRIGVLVRAGARRRAVGRIHVGHQFDRQLGRPSKSGTRTAQPPMHGMDDQRSIPACVVLPCNSLPSPLRVPSPSVLRNMPPTEACGGPATTRALPSLTFTWMARVDTRHGRTSGQCCAWLRGWRGGGPRNGYPRARN